MRCTSPRCMFANSAGGSGATELIVNERVPVSALEIIRRLHGAAAPGHRKIYCNEENVSRA